MGAVSLAVASVGAPPTADGGSTLGESGGSAERMAQRLAASGDAAAGAWAAGAAGERRVAAALETLPPDHLVLHDRLLLPGLSESNLDHVVVGPSGVLLVDAKNWAGNVTEYQGALIQHRRQPDGSWTHTARHRELAAVHGMSRTMAGRLGLPVTPVLCLAGTRAHRFGPPQTVRGIWVVPLPSLAGWITARAPTTSTLELEWAKTLVTTEFPSTTTDELLLAAIGRDLRQRTRTTPHRRRVAVPTRPAGRPSAPTGPPAPPVAPAPSVTRRQMGDARRAADRRRRNRRLRRRGAALVLLASVSLGISTGALASWGESATGWINGSAVVDPSDEPGTSPAPHPSATHPSATHPSATHPSATPTRR